MHVRAPSCLLRPFARTCAPLLLLSPRRTAARSPPVSLQRHELLYVPQLQRLHVVHDADGWVGLWQRQQRQLQDGQRVGVHQPGGHPASKQLRGVYRRPNLRGADELLVVRSEHRLLLGDEPGGDKLVRLWVLRRRAIFVVPHGLVAPVGILKHMPNVAVAIAIAVANTVALAVIRPIISLPSSHGPPWHAGWLAVLKHSQ